MPQILQQKLPEAAKVPAVEPIVYDNSSFETLFKENFSRLCLYCRYKFGFDLDQAKEVVHTAFIKLWETRHSIAPDLSVKAYLYKIITNISYDIFRHDKVKQKHEKHVLENLVLSFNKNDFDKTEFNQLKNDIDKAVVELPDQCEKYLK